MFNFNQLHVHVGAKVLVVGTLLTSDTASELGAPFVRELSSFFTWKFQVPALNKDGILSYLSARNILRYMLMYQVLVIGRYMQCMVLDKVLFLKGSCRFLSRAL